MIDWPRSVDVESGVDCYVPLMSLRLHFDTRVKTIPAAISYLEPRTDHLATWKQRLSSSEVKVGIVWSGNPRNLKDHFRSCKLADFAPLSDIPGVTFFILHKGLAAEQAKDPPAGMKLISLFNELTDFAQTAAAVACLDLVISVDTSVAHLAGTLCKPVWTVLPYSPDWRWLLVRDDTPWYPTMRLFRQELCGDWAGVFLRVADALRVWAPRRKPTVFFKPQASVGEGVDLHRGGKLDAAETMCRQVVVKEPHTQRPC